MNLRNLIMLAAVSGIGFGASQTVQHPTPAECLPSMLIERVFDDSLQGRPCIVLFAVINDSEAFAIGVQSEGKIVGLRRQLPIQTDGDIQRFSVRQMKECSIAPREVAALQRLIINGLKTLRFAEQPDLTTGVSDLYVVGSERFFGEIRDSYQGTAARPLAACNLLVKILESEADRDKHLLSLRELLADGWGSNPAG